MKPTDPSNPTSSGAVTGSDPPDPRRSGSPPESPASWPVRGWLSKRLIAGLLAASVFLAFSAKRTGVDEGVSMIAEGVGDMVGLVDDSSVGRGLENFWKRAMPLVLEERTEIGRIEGFDESRLPWLSSIQVQPVREFDAITGQWMEQGQTKVLVEPLGYLTRVIRLMFQTIEMAIWGTLLALTIAIPLAFFGTRDYCGHPLLYLAARGICSMNRAIPELISAMWFVLMFGFGSVPGILALGVHASGFLGKFFADDIENVPKGPQHALRSSGANRLKVIRFAVIPQALPQFVAYVQYILERNVRTATVLGIVGAGGIGMELKGRWDLSDFGHVSTILLVVFVTVAVLEYLTQRVRARII